MARRVSVRDLRNRTNEVVRCVEAGEQVTLTVNGQPVADIVPHRARSERVPAKVLLAELAALHTGPAEPWPTIEITTDDAITGVDDRD
jgi:prevent-host-death family protein